MPAESNLQHDGPKADFPDFVIARHQAMGITSDNLKYPEQIKALALESRQKFLASLIESDRYVRSKGATFIHVLQPDHFTKPLRSFELPLVENHFLTMEGVEPALPAAHEEFASITPSLVAQGVKAYDATDLFNAIDDPIFFRAHQ